MSLDYNQQLIAGYKVLKSQIYEEITEDIVVNSCEHRERLNTAFCPICGKEVKSTIKTEIVDYKVFIPDFWDEDCESLADHEFLHERYSNCDEDDFVIVGVKIPIQDAYDESSVEKIIIPTQQEVDNKIRDIKIPKDEYGLYYITSIY